MVWGDRFRGAIPVRDLCRACRRRDLDLFRSGSWAPGLVFGQGLSFATSLQVFIHGRAAVADMPLVFFFFLTATWADWERSRNPKSAFWWWIFYLSLGLGFLAKGPARLIACLLHPRPSVSQSCLLTELRTSIDPPGGDRGPGVIGLWGIPALDRDEGCLSANRAWETCTSAFVATDGEPWRSRSRRGYLLFLPFYLASASSAFSSGSSFYRDAVKPTSSSIEIQTKTFFWGQFLTVFFVFTLDSDQVPHYVLPAYPMLAILVARQAAKSRWRRGLLGVRPDPLSPARSGRISS